MKRAALAALLALLAPIAAGAMDESAELERAKAATAAFAGALKSELMAAMQAGGPLNAIEVCHTRAEVIAGEVSRDQGVRLSRVSLKNRNPANAPNDWQSPVLEAFDRERAAGRDAGALTWHEVSETDGGREFRFMKAIPTGGLCLQCHGTSIAPEVAEKIAGLYPDDRARDYEAGDVRGAFVVTRPLDR